MPASPTSPRPGGVWSDPNGWLTWAYVSQQGVLHGAVDAAWSEYVHNTLANHAAVWPDHWDGTISVDDACHGYSSASFVLPGRAGQPADWARDRLSLLNRW